MLAKNDYFCKIFNEMNILSLKLFWEFFKIGAFTFGGGYAMIALVKNALVERHRWMTDDEFTECITLAQSLPGVFAINMALYTGFKIAKKTGAGFAMLGAALPSMIIIVVIAAFIQNINDYKVVKDVFAGIRPCVIALILVPGLNLLKKAKLTKSTFWIPILTCLLICLLGVSPMYLIIAAIVGGVIWARATVGKTASQPSKTEEDTK